MAIKNTSLGGTDWTSNDYITSTDLNDTFNALVDRTQTLSAFWLNSDLRTRIWTADDYATSTYLSLTDDDSGSAMGWSFTSDSSQSYSSTVTVQSVAASVLDTTNNEMLITQTALKGASTNTFTATATLSTSVVGDKHLYLGGYVSASGENDENTTYSVSVAGSTFLTVTSSTGIPVWPFSIFVVAKGSGVYDIYGPHKILGTDVSIATLSVKITTTVVSRDGDRTVKIYVKEAYQSANDIT